jgi:hypothetical protein
MAPRLRRSNHMNRTVIIPASMTLEGLFHVK